MSERLSPSAGPVVAVLTGDLPARSGARLLRALRAECSAQDAAVSLRWGAGLSARVAAAAIGERPPEEPETEDWFSGAALALLPAALPVTRPQVMVAMREGIPVVATDYPPAREWLGSAGVFVPPQSGAQGLAQAAVRLLRDPTERENLGRRGRAQARRWDRRERPAPAASPPELPAAAPTWDPTPHLPPPDGTLHVLCPSGVGDFLWIWRKFWKVAEQRPVRFWFAEGEQQRAGAYAELVGAESGYLPGLDTGWVWSRPGSPSLPSGGGWVTVHANRHLEAGEPLSSWYPDLPLGHPRPALPPRQEREPYAYVFAGRRDYMEGNLPTETWARLLRRLETALPVKLVGAGIDREWLKEIAERHGGGTVELLLDRPLREVLTAAQNARLVFGLAGGPTIAALCLGVPSVLAYPRWLYRMPGTWEPNGCCWDWCFVSELERKLEWLLGSRWLMADG